MGTDAFTDRAAVLRCLDTIEAAYDQLQNCSFDGFDGEELAGLLSRREALARRAPTVDHRILARLVTAGNPGELGAALLSTALADRLRISRREARRRLREADELGPRSAVTGQPLQPVLPNIAAAQAAGRIGAEHVAIARKACAKIPATVAASDRARAERDMAQLACDFAPETFQKLADHLIAVLDPDGDFDDRERQVRRGVRIGRQSADGMSTVTGKITPELRATLEPLLAKLAAPGMCNSADELPSLRGTPTEEQIRSDHRTAEQRQHDALLALCRIALCGKDLGKLNGLPVTVIVTTTLAQLQAAADGSPAGRARTAGDTALPMPDLLRMASHAYHYLTVFDDRGRALWLGRTKRIASADQRIVLHARDHGCTRPGCTVSGYLAQAHHLQRDWAEGGRTDINTLGLACAPDNRMASEQGWSTRLGEQGRVEWIPPPALERGQPRTNPYHFIEDLIAYHRREPDPPDHPPEYWLDDPLPGEPEYERVCDALDRAYAADLRYRHE